MEGPTDSDNMQCFNGFLHIYSKRKTFMGKLQYVEKDFLIYHLSQISPLRSDILVFSGAWCAESVPGFFYVRCSSSQSSDTIPNSCSSCNILHNKINPHMKIIPGVFDIKVILCQLEMVINYDTQCTEQTKCLDANSWTSAPMMLCPRLCPTSTSFTLNSVVAHQHKWRRDLGWSLW